MTEEEIDKAKRILGPYVDRTRRVRSDDMGWGLIVRWLDGGESLFYALNAIEKYSDPPRNGQVTTWHFQKRAVHLNADLNHAVIERSVKTGESVDAIVAAAVREYLKN